jgi:spermidine synthase
MSHRRAAVFYALFFLSGAASLADEVVWFKYLNFVFGSTTAATATLVAVFMAGLGLGAWAMGRIAPRLARPTLVYSGLEAGVAVFALATPALFGAVEQGYVFAYRHLGSGPAGLTAARIVLSAAALLAPTFLMGATFPALARHVEAGREPGRSSGGLYAVNTAGAVAGVLVSAFVFIPLWGLWATLVASACVSLLAALIAAASRASAPREEPDAPLLPAGRWLLIAFWTGLAAMADEVLWTRVLVFHLGSEVYSFALMLAIYLAGVVGGSLWGSVRASGNVEKRLYRAQIALGLVLAAQVLAFLVFVRGLVFVGVNVVSARGFGGLLATQALVTSLYLLPATVLMGYTFALLLRAAGGTPREAPRRAGAVYAANTFGGIVGALVSGFVAIPLLGTQNSLVAAALVAIGAAVLVRPAGAAAWIAAPVVLGAAFLAPRDGVILSTGVLSSGADRRIVFYDEGVTATVSVAENLRPRPWLSLELNGVNVAGTSPNLLVTQELQGHLPLCLARDPRAVLHIGFGSGGTAHAVSLHPVRRIRVVEISPEIPEAADRFFRSVNHGVLRDPRLRLTINDGRNFVLADPETFDVILSDSIHPRYAGNGSLYTEDYFRLCARRLRPGGVISMWLPMYSLRTQDFRSIVRAFRDVFPHVSIWYPLSVESPFTIVLATPGRTISLARLAERMDDPPVRADLARIGVDDPATMLSYLLLGPEDVDRWVADVPPHTDDLPTVEYGSGRLTGPDRTWLETFAELVARRGRIEDFVRDLRPGDALSERVRARYRDSASVLGRHLADLARRARSSP